MEWYARAVFLHPDRVEAWHDLSRSLLLSGNTRAARHTATTALMLAPTDAALWLHLAGVCLAAGEFSQAVHCCVTVLNTDQASSTAWETLGKIYYQMGNEELAKRALEKSQTANPLAPTSWVGLAMLSTDNYLKETWFRRALELDAAPIAGLGYAVASARNQTFADGALVPLQLYVAEHPRDGYALNICGLYEEKAGLLESAERRFRRAIELLESGDPNKSDPALDSRFDVQETLTNARLNLARILASSGSSDAAKTLLAKCPGPSVGRAEVLTAAQMFGDALSEFDALFAAGGAESGGARVRLDKPDLETLPTTSLHLSNEVGDHEYLFRQWLRAVVLARGANVAESETKFALIAERVPLGSRRALMLVVGAYEAVRAGARAAAHKVLSTLPADLKRDPAVLVISALCEETAAARISQLERAVVMYPESQELRCVLSEHVAEDIAGRVFPSFSSSKAARFHDRHCRDPRLEAFVLADHCRMARAHYRGTKSPETYSVLRHHYLEDPAV